MRAFLAFSYLSKSHAWRGSPFWHREPPLLARASQPKNLPFQPCGRRVSPIQAASFHLQSGDGECLPATQLYLSVFTCPTVSLNLPSDAGASTPARRPYLFHPTAGEAYPSRPRVFSSGRMLARASWPHSLFSVSLDLPLDAGASSPARQSYLSNLLLNEAYPSDTAIPKPVGRRREPPGQTALPFQIYCSTRLTRPTRRFWNQSDVGESLRDRQLSFSILRPARPTQPRCRLTARPSDPLNFAFLSKPVRLGEPRSPDGRRREHSRPDNLTFPSPELGKVYPSDTAIAEATVGRRREPPSQTILPFKVPCSAKLTHPARQLLKPPSDVGESFPARQLILSVCSHHDIELRRTLRARPFRQS